MKPSDWLIGDLKPEYKNKTKPKKKKKKKKKKGKRQTGSLDIDCQVPTIWGGLGRVVLQAMDQITDIQLKGETKLSAIIGLTTMHVVLHRMSML